MSESHAFENLTVKQAEDLLSRNESNRSVRESRVNQYARDMLNDNWHLCTAPIVVDTSGRLIDGQHRLLAQVKAKKRIKWLVLRNVKPELQATIDTGAPRSFTDVLHFNGEAYPGQLAATSRLVAQYKMGALQGRKGENISIDEILQVLDEEPGLRHSVEVTANTRGSMTPIASSILATAHWMISKVNGDEEATSFITRIINLTGETTGSPVLALNRRANEIKRASQRVKRKDWLALVIKAWNYDATGKAVNKIALYSKTGEYVLPKVEERTASPFLLEWEEDDEVMHRDAGDEPNSA